MSMLAYWRKKYCFSSFLPQKRNVEMWASWLAKAQMAIKHTTNKVFMALYL